TIKKTRHAKTCLYILNGYDSMNIDTPTNTPDLIARSLSGQPDAFEGLMRNHHKRLLYFLVRLMRDHEKAEDVSQEVWLTVHRGLHTLRSAQAFKSWLYQIARFHAYRAMKRETREVRTESLDAVAENVL